MCASASFQLGKESLPLLYLQLTNLSVFQRPFYYLAAAWLLPLSCCRLLHRFPNLFISRSQSAKPPEKAVPTSKKNQIKCWLQLTRACWGGPWMSTLLCRLLWAIRDAGQSLHVWGTRSFPGIRASLLQQSFLWETSITKYSSVRGTVPIRSPVL